MATLGLFGHFFRVLWPFVQVSFARSVGLFCLFYPLFRSLLTVVRSLLPSMLVKAQNEVFETRCLRLLNTHRTFILEPNIAREGMRWSAQ